MRWTWMFAAMLAALALAAMGCGCGDDDDDDDDDDAATDDDASDDDAADDDATDDDAADDDTDDNVLDDGWVWMPVDGAICRDGTDTGVMIRESAGSDKLLILLQGGGACYSESTCADNPSHFDLASAQAVASGMNQGILNNTSDANPAKDWNVVYVPYCTGDVFAGNDPEGFVAGVGPQAYVGYTNMKSITEDVVAEFPEVTRVLLAGESAGGFGTMFNYKTVAEAFAPTRVDMFDDSGPLPADDAVLAPCYQTLLTFQFGATDVAEEVCPDCILPSGDGYSDFAVYYAEQYPNSTFGLYSTLQDATIRDFFGAGQDDCTGTGLIPAEDFEDALIDYRDNDLIPASRWGTFYREGDAHTCVNSNDAFLTDETGGTTVAAWLTDLLNDTIAQVDPS
ncbi:MAG: hypothetical protein IT350_05210 [Deltaproteobacteria bacterium]|nr:hypothetical protein [Deltaproteobacteria bacterium]